MKTLIVLPGRIVGGPTNRASPTEDNRDNLTDTVRYYFFFLTDVVQ